MAFRLDAEDINQVQALFDTIISQNERITAVIHNVGEYSLNFYAVRYRFYSNVAIHFLSAYLVSQSCLKIFKEQNHGTLILPEPVLRCVESLFCSFHYGEICLADLCIKLSSNFSVHDKIDNSLK